MRPFREDEYESGLVTAKDDALLSLKHCFLLLHAIAVLPRENANPNGDPRSPTFSAQSASV